MGRSREEQETIVRFDRASTVATFWTAAALVAAKWRRLGYPLVQDAGGWRSEVPINRLSFRRLGQKPPQAEKRAVPPGFLKMKSAGRVLSGPEC